MAPFSTKCQFLLFTSTFERLLNIFQVLQTPVFTFYFYILTLFEARQGQFDPQHHTYVCSFYSNRARLTKSCDFVSLTIWLVPKKPFLKFLLQNFWKIWILNFWGSSSISRKLKILTKKIIFLQRFSFFLAESILYMFSAFFWGI